MQSGIGWALLLLGGFMYLIQLLSSVNFELAQRLGVQEDPEESDSLLQTAERYAAYWDLLTLGWLPLAGLLMVVDHEWWPIIALVGGAIYFDTAGREAAKFLSLKREGVRMGTERQQRLFFASYVVMAVIGMVVVGYALNALLSSIR